MLNMEAWAAILNFDYPVVNNVSKDPDTLW